MPCYTPDADDYARSELATVRDKLKFTEALLCAVMTAISGKINLYDEMELCADETGVTYADLDKWWYAHQAKDAARKANEAAKQKAKAERQALRKAALAKLSVKERKALGLYRK